MTTKIYLSLFLMLSTLVSIAQTESQEEQFKKSKAIK